MTNQKHPYRSPESLGRAMKADLVNYAPLLAVIRDAEKKRQTDAQLNRQAFERAYWKRLTM